MFNSKRLRPLIFRSMIFVIALLLAGSAIGQDKTWDQAEVTKLANELEQTLQAVYEESLKAAPQQTALQQRERDAAQGGIRRTRDLSKEYARRMREGWDLETSKPIFQAVEAEFKRIRNTAGEAVPSKSAESLIRHIESVLAKLRAQYNHP